MEGLSELLRLLYAVVKGSGSASLTVVAALYIRSTALIWNQ
jgi:hypothetical protein